MNALKIAAIALLASVALAPLASSEDAPANAPKSWNEGGGEQEEALKLTPNLENGRDV